MSTEVEKTEAMVAAMHSALLTNKELHRKVERLEQANQILIQALEFIEKLHENDVVLTSTEYNHKSAMTYRKAIQALEEWNAKHESK